MKSTHHFVNVLSRFFTVKILKNGWLLLGVLIISGPSVVQAQIDPLWELELKNFDIRTYKAAVDRLFNEWEYCY